MKTLYQVCQHYMWPSIPEFIKDYCKSCTTCSCAKPQQHKPYSLLKQLPVPEKPWNTISMDLIEQLPSSSGYTSILVIVDCLSKQSLFIPTHNTITSHNLVQLFVLHVFSKHRVPSHVMSDCGSEFVSHFFQSLSTALNMKLHFTSSSHPEGDGQTKHTNQTLDSTSGCTATTSRTTGPASCPSWSSRTTIHLAPLLAPHHSLPTRDTIPT